LNFNLGILDFGAILVILGIVLVFFQRGLNTSLSVLVKGQIDKKTTEDRQIFEKEFEKLKNQLQLDFKNKEEALNKKREVYVNLIDSMTVFIGKRVHKDDETEYKRRFLKSYDIAWLWASDEVMLALSTYMQFKIDHGRGIVPVDGAHPGEREKELFAACVLAMRRDIGFSDTTITKENYKFINF
jgi:malate synthase